MSNLLSPKKISRKERKEWEDYIYDSSSCDEIASRVSEWASFIYDHPIKISLQSFRTDYAKASHSSPKGKKAGWGPTCPLYDAISGKVSIQIEQDGNKGPIEFNSFGSYATSSFIHIGTGGGRADGLYQYSMTIWLDDYPKIKKDHEFNKRMDEIKKKYAVRCMDLVNEWMRSDKDFQLIESVHQRHKDMVNEIVSRLNRISDEMNIQKKELVAQERKRIEEELTQYIEEEIDMAREEIYGK